MKHLDNSHETVLVVDFGAQYAQLIARRVREARVYSEIVPNTISADEIALRQPAALIFSGGPKSVHIEGAPSIDPDVYSLGIPILGICYGSQLIARQLGGIVDPSGRGEYGRTELRLTSHESSILPSDLETNSPVWMSHFDAISQPPEGFTVTAATNDAPAAVIENNTNRIYGVQYHPEVVHTPHGQKLLETFLTDIAGCNADWTMANVIEESVTAIRQQVGESRAICGLSGGVDSAVAAALVHKAIGSQLVCVFVDTGLMRLGEGDQVVETFQRTQGIEPVSYTHLTLPTKA